MRNSDQPREVPPATYAKALAAQMRGPLLKQNQANAALRLRGPSYGSPKYLNLLVLIFAMQPDPAVRDSLGAYPRRELE